MPGDFMPKRDEAPTQTQTLAEQAKVLRLWGRVWEERFGEEG